jgi:hypothetical protein
MADAQHHRHLVRLDWNRLDDEQRFAGWRLTDAVRDMAAEHARLFHRCGCEQPGSCIHAAAAGINGLLRIIEHPPDCPRCAELRTISETPDESPE